MTNIERNFSQSFNREVVLTSPKHILRLVQTNMERTFILRKFNENLVKNVMKACSRSSYLSLKQMTGAVDNSGVMVALPIGRERIWHDNTWPSKM